MFLILGKLKRILRKVKPTNRAKHKRIIPSLLAQNNNKIISRKCCTAEQTKNVKTIYATQHILYFIF